MGLTLIVSRVTAALGAAVLVLILSLGSGPASGQGAGRGPALLVLNQERLVSETRYGQRIQSELDAALAALAAENRQIEAELSDEELRLTDLRDTLSAEEFRPLADEFDTRVEGIRAAQAAKARDLQAQAEAAQARFFELVLPIMLDLVRSRGASVLMDSRGVLLSADGVDVTDEAIARIDSELGNGGEAPLISLQDAGGDPEPAEGAGDDG